MLDKVLDGYENLLHVIAEIAVHTLELIGILIILIGSVRVLIQVVKQLRNGTYTQRNIVIPLGRCLALALEFKMGAVIINTVIIHELKELLVLAIIIALHAILAVLIHWEIKNEKKDDDSKKTEKQETKLLSESVEK